MSLPWLIGLCVLAALVLYLLFWPTPVRPLRWTPQPAPSRDLPPYARNEALKNLQRIAAIGGTGPEGISVDAAGLLYAGYLDGRVMRFAADGSDGKLLANTGGRPFGTLPLPDGRVLVADGIKGLIEILPGGAVRVLSTASDGVPFRFTNDLDIARAGDAIYFSDSSFKFGVGHHVEDILEHGRNGRLLRYDTASGRTTTLMEGLCFPNGVAMGPNDDFVLVAESSEYRVLRYWLRGEKAGHSDVFVDNLPGFPDNLSFNGRERFWLAIAAPRDPQVDKLADALWLRKVISRLPAFLQPSPPLYGMALALDLQGRVTANLQYEAPGAYMEITSVCEHGPWLYCGSVIEQPIARLPLQRAFADAPAPPSAIPLPT